MTARQFARDALGWGVALWLFGYVLSIALFAFVPASLLGWLVTPFGIAATLLVLARHVGGPSLGYYVLLGVTWAVLAVVLDYLFIVRLFQPTDGYYKLDVYLYYVLTLLLPVAVGARRVAAH